MLKKKEVGGMFQKKAVGDAMSKFTGRIQATAKHIGKKAHKFKVSANQLLEQGM